MVSTRSIVIGGLACVAVTGAAMFAWRYTHPAAKTKTKTRRKKSAAVKTGAKADQSVVTIPPESDLVNRLLASMERMQMTGSIVGQSEVELFKIVASAAAAPDSLSVRSRLMAAQWTILYQTLVSVSLSAETIDIVAHEAVMKEAWALLNMPLTNLNSEERIAVDILQMDVSQRLRSPSLMIPAYERLLRRMSSSPLSNEEMLVLFTSSPMLGRWDDTRRIGDAILSKQKSLDDFHQAALQRPELPDYSVLYDQALARKSGDQSNLAWAAYRIRALRIRVRDIQSLDASKVAAIRGVIAEGWQATSVTPEKHLFRHGAIGQMQSASDVKISCVGPWDGSRLDLQGWAELQKGPSNADDHVRQTERYEFECEGTEPSDGIWSGTYTLSQDERDSSITVIFDLELDLALDEKLSPTSSDV